MFQGHGVIPIAGKYGYCIRRIVVGCGFVHPTIPGVTWVGTGRALSSPGPVHDVPRAWRHTHCGNIWVLYPTNCGGVGVLYPTNCGGVGVLYPTNCGGVCGQGRPCPYGYGYGCGYDRCGRMGIVPDELWWGGGVIPGQLWWGVRTGQALSLRVRVRVRVRV